MEVSGCTKVVATSMWREPFHSPKKRRRYSYALDPALIFIYPASLRPDVSSRAPSHAPHACWMRDTGYDDPEGSTYTQGAPFDIIDPSIYITSERSLGRSVIHK